ncbi:MAG TPA: hypothetical protein VJN29_00360 [Intrasporangium sp.]|uniref:hypothetical protein n=1 Tax=Intrasporangium sp. TaxID=1925024 RepID=UPI002B483165|nr:hypothetical protein [Intrasporangium sp.]HKX65649.1 hypothetical protein [Intrasporangium sp.]
MAESRDGTQTAPPGSVADEAALLVDLLSARGWGGPAAGQSDRSSDGSRESSETGSRAHRGECSCGGTTPAACRLCPVCQLISFVQRLSPDTLDTVADVVELAATGLRDLAHAQRDRQDQEGPPSGPPTEGTNPG